MSKKLDSIVISSALAIAAVSCGGSNSPSNTPTAAGDEQSTIAGSTESTQPPMASGSTGIDSSSTSGSDGAPLGTRTGKLNDAQIAAITDSVNSAEIEQARIARSKSQNEQVRRFASMMIEHHSEARAQQAALNLETAESPLSQQLAIESQATLETLKAKNGADFDSAYLQAQIEAHQKALDTIVHDLQPSAQEPALQRYLENLTPKVAQHLEQARSAQQSLQTGDTGVRSSSTTNSR
jgi:putative membrane protein